MGESTKAVCVVLLIVGAIGTPIAWITDQPNAVAWGFRIAAPTLALLALGLILTLHFRKDVEYDYLRPIAGTYFNRDGFCFAIFVNAIGGVAFMDAYFQTQYDKRSVGRIALRPARGFFMTRAKIDTITFEIECPPAGFGFSRIAIPVPENLQGKRQSFEVGASVEYPDGKGRRVRFHDGVFLRSNTNFEDSLGTALMIAGAATGSLVLSNPETTKTYMPVDVADEVPDGLVPESKILWQLGEPAIEVSV